MECIELANVDFANMNLQEMFDHRFELNRQHELELRLIDEMRAQQAKIE